MATADIPPWLKDVDPVVRAVAEASTGVTLEFIVANHGKTALSTAMKKARQFITMARAYEAATKEVL